MNKHLALVFGLTCFAAMASSAKADLHAKTPSFKRVKAVENKPTFWKWAQKPPMGWNSWDSFATTVTESQTKAQADYMAEKLARFGWKYIIVDIQWYEGGATGFDYRADAPLTMDEWGRLQPASNKFPSAGSKAGFKALADYIHSKGLKFGIHMMRGIPRQAVKQNVPIKGSTVHAAEIADTKSTCPWNSDMYGVDMSKPGAQEYYNSLYEMFAGWGVDFVKVDDLSRPYHQPEIEAIRKAIDRTRRPIVFSTSPGDTPVSSGEHVQDHANMWRISDDFWDDWHALFEQFKRLNDWTPFRASGHFPDADMLPLGAIRQVAGSGLPQTRFTRDEQVTMMSLWSIVRSPLMMGGDLTKNDDFTLSLLTNDEVLAVNQNSLNNRQLYNKNGQVAWIADVPNSSDKYLALFNTNDARTFDLNGAAFQSKLITPRNAGAHGQEVDIDISRAKKLYLVVNDGGDGFVADHFDWSEPRLIDPNGKELKLTDLHWTSATAGWGKPSTTIAAGGKEMSVEGKKVAYGIGTHAESIIEFDLPFGYTRFKAFAALDDGGTSQPLGATVNAMVFTHSPYIESTSAHVEVTPQELGFGNGLIKIRDLWKKKEIGSFNASFAADLAPHASGLYRLTPIKSKFSGAAKP